MITDHGDFVWYELAASNPGAAVAFYQDAIGWQGSDAGIPGMSYTIMAMAGANVVGIMSAPPGAEPRWTGYVAVDDVDAAATKAAALGGTVQLPPSDIPGIGRFAVVADPQGAAIALFRGTGEPPSVPLDTPGHGGWRELHAGDWKAAWPFYEALFGWSMQQAVEMGPAGTYQVFGNGGDALGGFMNDGSAGASRWLYYFNVAGIDDAVARVRMAGGIVTAGPHEVPGGTLIVHCTDQGGTPFALSGRARIAG